MQYSYLSDTSQTLSIQTRVQGPVVWRPISANLRLTLSYLETALNNPAQGSNFQATLSGGVINKWDWTMKLLIYLL